MGLRTITAVCAAITMVCIAWGSASAEEERELSHQLFFRGAYSALTESRANEVFTDTAGAAGLTNGGTGGWSVAAGLDLSAGHIEDMGNMNVMGEVFAEFSRFSNQPVVQATSALLGAPIVRRVTVTELNVTIAPKARFDGLGNGRIRPFVVPIGLSFLVNSPPSDDTNYLDVGLHFGGGLDVLVVDRISVGWDVRYTHGFDQSNTNTRYWSTGVYAGLNF